MSKPDRQDFELFSTTHMYNFESIDKCRELRAKIQRADNKKSAEGFGPPQLPSECTSDCPCGSGLCPACMREARLTLLRFVYDSDLSGKGWLFVTVFVEGWTIAPGDHRPFGELGNHRVIRRFLQSIRRMNLPNVRLIGGIETVYKVVGNQPVGKPFHLHFMVKGLSHAQVRAALQHIPKDPKVPVAADIQEVGNLKSDFIYNMSYVLKQTFWKSTKSNSRDRKSARQWPNPTELSELISNFGAHSTYARLFMLGVRRDRGRFRTL